MPRILVVDDSDVVRDLCRQFLVMRGHEVLEASNGAPALEIYRAERPDAVLLDIAMPGVSGIQVLRDLREFDPDARVAMLTGLHDTTLVREALALGARDYVVKPFASHRIYEAIRRLLAPSRPPDAATEAQ